MYIFTRESTRVSKYNILYMKRRIHPLYLLIIPVLGFIIFSFKKSDKNQLSFDPSYSLWYDEPAGAWEEALPVGNGRLGAMVFGLPVHEKLQINIE